MSCWRRTTVLRIPAIFLGFTYWREWDEFVDQHRKEMHWDPGYFAVALCESYPWSEYAGLLPEGRPRGPMDRLDMNLYPGRVQSVPGPFLDYYLDEISPLRPEDNTYHTSVCARPL